MHMFVIGVTIFGVYSGSGIGSSKLPLRAKLSWHAQQFKQSLGFVVCMSTSSTSDERESACT